jgi:hemolysin III
MAKKTKRPQTLDEEKANTLTHGFGLILVLFTYPFLIQKAYAGGNIFSIIGVIMFFFGSVCMYAASSFYHYERREKLKLKLRVVDHISIFFLIGGTYSAVVQKYVPVDTASWFMATMWGIIVLGSLLKLFFTGKYQWLSVMLYLFLGWMAVFIARPLNDNMPPSVFYWLLAGGLAYTLGVIFYKNQKLMYSHAIWHLFVLAGTFFHYVAILKSY